MTIPVAHDFSCAWCWIGLHQVLALKREFGLEFEWLGYEMFPEWMAFPEPTPIAQANTNRPKTPSRLELAYAAQGMDKPTNRGPGYQRTHDAHEAVELAKLSDAQDAAVERLYRAYWEEGADLSQREVVIDLAGAFVDRAELEATLNERRFASNIVEFDEDAFSMGVYNVPTFWIDGRRFAEMPLVTLRRAILSSLSAVS